ncbi:hypothetical protein B0T17DRAFT_503222 [Bombardia bombarda]|uniref:Uncharacterized protein n=1 Tax=Bombardia bombarda TaxID=252184 RepID=A0AA39XKK1_9PEZI|nr:hypothetical protein B0T17DRAFT_503222 [Bombardia bombarda]
MSERETPKIAHVEDVDESGNIVKGSSRYAASVVSPSKERPNTGRARREREVRRDSSSPVTSGLTDSDSTVHPRRGDSLKKAGKDRDKSLSNTKKAIIPIMRPPVKHSKTTPSLPRRDIEASYYGVGPGVTAATSRPRAHTGNPRPMSYYGSSPSRPPPANARFYASQTPAPLPTSFPPPSWAGGAVPIPYPSQSPAAAMPQQSPDYFARPLESRFGPGRPQSAMGYRAPRSIGFDDFEPEHERSLTRRPSSHRKSSRPQDDRRAMPPPPRPASARPTSLAFRPPPSTPVRRQSVGYDDDEIEGDGGLFHISPLATYEHSVPIPIRSKSKSRRPRRPSVGATSITYDAGDYRTEVAGKGGRRHSYYGGNKSASSGSGYEDKLRQAALYQDDMTGSNGMPLTAETLRKAGKNGGSSRSSGSRDESDYRQSATTRTTRSSANDEDVTIRVKGSTVLKYGGAEMQCRDGAEINIISRGATPFRTGSDKSIYLEQDDRRTRIERLPSARTRASSQAPSSYSRPMPIYDAGHSHSHAYDAGPGYDQYYSVSPAIPPYPQYPSGFGSHARDDDYYGQ